MELLHRVNRHFPPKLRGPAQNLAALGHWAPVSPYPWILASDFFHNRSKNMKVSENVLNSLMAKSHYIHHHSAVFIFVFLEMIGYIQKYTQELLNNTIHSNMISLTSFIDRPLKCCIQECIDFVEKLAFMVIFYMIDTFLFKNNIIITLTVMVIDLTWVLIWIFLKMLQFYNNGFPMNLIWFSGI